ncbi:hypothetical protein P8452_53556 [Trifolium repens]|nr:hypothetical protein P8452_53556 [Trifolium repens]
MLISLLPIPNHPIINQCYFFSFVYNGIITPILQNFSITAGRPNFVKDGSEVSCIVSVPFDDSLKVC